MVCPKCSAVIQEGSNFCPNCGEKCFNMPVDNREQLQPNSDAKKHCRNCNKEIREGTLCKKCLRKLNQEQLTKDERKLRNDNRDKIGCLCACFGLAPIVVGVILMFSISFLVGLIIAGIGVLLFLPWLLTRGSVCPACQRRKTMQRVHS